MAKTRTVSQYVTSNGNRGELMVQEGYRVNEVNDPTVVEDAISDLLHLLESIYGIQNDYTAKGVRFATLYGVERAIGHWFSESVYADDHGDEDSDVLGGIPIYRAEISIGATED